MDILHILRSVPDMTTEEMVHALSDQKRSGLIRLYETKIEWDEIVDAIFDSKRIVCWW